MESWWIKFGVFWWFISSKKSWQVYKVTNVFKNLCYSNDTATCLFGIFPVLMWEYGHRLTCILCSPNIKRLRLRGCLSGTRCQQIHIAKEAAEISVCNVCQGVFFFLFVSCKEERTVLKIFSLEIYIDVRKRKMYHLHFKALHVPVLAEVVIN